jgi:hypothetical protein
MSNGLEKIRILVINRDGIDDVELCAWADSTVGAFKKRLGEFYKAPPGLINVVLQVGLERYVLARMQCLKVGSTANSTIDLVDGRIHGDAFVPTHIVPTP